MKRPITRIVSAAAPLALVFSAVTILGSAPAADATCKTYYAAKGRPVNMRMSAAIRSLPVAGERPGGYTRTKFKTWTDQDRDGRNTRAEVLQQESLTKVTGGDTVKTGKWYDWYTGQTYTRASKLDIDHLVPLKEAWSSGAKGWSGSRREAFANDLGDNRSLNAVSLSANRSKGDREPDQWLPPRNDSRYVESWVAVKVRWSLRVDKTEQAYLLYWANRAGNPQIKTTRAVVKTARATATKSSGVKKSSSVKESSSTTEPSGGNDPRFRTAAEAIKAGYGPYYEGKDPEYSWYKDADHDGITCER